MTSTNAIASTMLRRSLEDRMEQSENDLNSWIHNHTGQFTAYVAGALCAMLIVYCFVRELVFHKWGYDCCPGMKRGRSREDQLQMAEDARMALELQQSLQEEDRRLAVEGKRMERRQKYEKFLVPYTMVVKDEDLFYCSEINGTTSPAKEPSISEDADGVLNDLSTSKKDVDLEAGATEERELLLRLPVKNDKGEQRHVDGNCTICLLDYEAGDSVVWATRKVCTHAFHDECILLWLSKGKKRCPICRNFFVPGTSVDDKKVISHDENDRHAVILEDEASSNSEEEIAETTTEEDTSDDSDGDNMDGSQRIAAERVLSRRLSAEVNGLDTSGRGDSELQLLVRHLQQVSDTLEDRDTAKDLKPIIEELSALAQPGVIPELCEVQAIAERLMSLSTRTGEMDTSRRNTSELRVIARALKGFTSEDLTRGSTWA